MKKEKILVFILFALSTLLCSYPIFVHLGDLSARTYDESRNGVNAIEMLYNHNYLVTYFQNTPDLYNSKPPLFIWSVVMCMKFLGTTVFALRLPSALSCLFITIYSFWFFKNRFNSLVAGVVSGFVLVTSIGFMEIHVTRNGDFDAMLSMWMFFYSTQFFLYFESQKPKHLIWASAFILMAILTKGVAGCLAFPGIFLFLIINKNCRLLLKRKELYIVPLLSLIVGLSYYFLREHFNPGYINAVLENEITGRYMKTNENHTGGVLYYWNFITDIHYKFWIYCIPISLILIFLRGEQLVKKFGLFLLVQTLLFLIVITVSKTKNLWYDAPLYPFFAMIVGLGFHQLYCEIKNFEYVKNKSIKLLGFVAIGFFVFVIPVKALFATPILAEKETFYPELFYGDFTSSVLNLFPNQKKLNILSQGYNPSLLFYSAIFKHNGKEVNILSPQNKFIENDTFLVCEPIMYPKADSAFAYDTLYAEDRGKYFIRVISKTEFVRNKPERIFLSEVNEIKSIPDWMTAMEKKVKESGVPLEKQIMLDALWLLENEKRITHQQSDSLQYKFKLL